MDTREELAAAVQMEVVSLSQSVTELMTSMQNLRQPLTDSHQKVPQATNQLDKISQQTLAAANRMLDVVEGICQREEQILTEIGTLISAVGAQPEAAPRASCTLIQAAAQANLDAAYALMDAMQFQDITSQQVDHAAALLTEIELKLANILKALGVSEAEVARISGTMPTRKRAYDPHADLFEKKTNQQDIDTLFDGRRRAEKA